MQQRINAAETEHRIWSTCEQTSLTQSQVEMRRDALNTC